MTTTRMDAHNFGIDMRKSNADADLPLWEEIYRKAFPDFVSMVYNHDLKKQLAGIDREVFLGSGKSILVDEKLRGRAKDGSYFGDILLEYVSNDKLGTPGWVCKPLLCHYILYAIGPAGKAYFLPVKELQAAWKENQVEWMVKPTKRSPNSYNGESWYTLSKGVSVGRLFKAMRMQPLCTRFKPYDDPDWLRKHAPSAN